MSYKELEELCKEVEDFEDNFFRKFSKVDLVDKLKSISDMGINENDPYKDWIVGLNQAMINRWLEKWSWKGE